MQNTPSIPRRGLWCALMLVSSVVSVPVRSELPPLIPREVLFGNPERTNPQLSPDGKRLAWVAPDTN
ncbi:MAG: hypothetical protein JNL97_05465, partial [Verrucomicrobiales bacterium]|nr:hypothetical protein [Verrucomicrobiales bacterium]